MCYWPWAYTKKDLQMSAVLCCCIQEEVKCKLQVLRHYLNDVWLNLKQEGEKEKKKEAPLTSFNEHQHKTEHSNYVKGKKKSWEPVRRHASTGHLLQRKMPIRSEFLILELLVRHNDKWWSQIRHCHIRVPHSGVTGQAQWQVMVTDTTLSH